MSEHLSDAEVAELERLEKAAGYQQGHSGQYIDLAADGRYTDAARNALPRLLAERRALREVLAAFLDKLVQVEPHIASAFFLAHTNRGHQYDGPTIEHGLAALRALLAYARLGVETYRLVDEAGMLVDRRDGIKSVRRDAGVTLAFELLETIEALGLLAPAVEKKEKQDAD